MPDLARGFPSDSLPQPDQAKSAYDAMGPEDQALVHMHADRLKAKGDPRFKSRAVAIVQNMNADVGIDSSPDVADSEASLPHKAAAFFQGLGESVIPTSTKDVVKAATINPMAWPVTSTLKVAQMMGNPNTSKEAQQEAPGAYGAGHLTGDIGQAVAGAAPILGSGVSALEDVLAGAKPFGVAGDEGFRLVSGATGAAAKRLLDKLGGAKNVAADVAEQAPVVGKPFAALRKALTQQPPNSMNAGAPEGLGGVSESLPGEGSIDMQGNVTPEPIPLTVRKTPQAALREALSQPLDNPEILTPDQAGAVTEPPDLPPMPGHVGREQLAAVENNMDLMNMLQPAPDPGVGPSTSRTRAVRPPAETPMAPQGLKPQAPPVTPEGEPPPSAKNLLKSKLTTDPGNPTADAKSFGIGQRFSVGGARERQLLADASPAARQAMIDAMARLHGADQVGPLADEFGLSLPDDVMNYSVQPGHVRAASMEGAHTPRQLATGAPFQEGNPDMAAAVEAQRIGKAPMGPGPGNVNDPRLDAVLKQMGYTDEQIAAMRTAILKGGS